MAVKVNEILRENREFYSETYSLVFTRRNRNMVVGIYILLCGFIAYFLKMQVFKEYYIEMSSQENLEGQEVLAWVQTSLRQHRFDKYTLYIFVGTVALMAFIFLINKFYNNYDLYKHRAIISLTPIIFVATELGILFIGLSEEAGIWTGGLRMMLKSALLVFNYVPLALTSRLFTTLEAREASEDVWNWIDWISNKVLRNL